MRLRYIEDMLVEHVVHYVGFISADFTFMHKNAKSHTARVVQKHMEEVGFRVRKWPACSPDSTP